MRLIDADALIETMRENAEGNEGWYGDTWAFMGDIESAPTIDTVRHGRWIESTTDLICSACETAFNDEIAWMCRDLPYGYPMYCPYCGTRMDGEDDETD